MSVSLLNVSSIVTLILKLDLAIVSGVSLPFVIVISFS